MRIIDTKRNRKRRLFRVGVALFLLCLVLSIASAQDQPSNIIPEVEVTPTLTATPTPTSRPVYINTTSTVNVTTAAPIISTKDAWAAILLLVIVFGALVGVGYWAKERGRLDMGEMRRAIAGTFVVGFTILVILCLTYDIYRSEVILAYIELVGIVIGFYFGTRTAAEKRAEAAVKISIEDVRFPDPKKIAITIRNGGDSEIKVDKIYINEGAFETDIKIDSQKSKEIEQVYEWKSETEYKIKIATMTGLTAEITKKSPEKTPEAES